jgi:ketosteroid isomerase-like protein
MSLTSDDHLEIRALIARYADTSSRKDVDGWVELFTDDAVWTRAAPAAGEIYNEKVEVRGRDALREFSAAEFPKAGTLLYVTGNEDITAEGEGAVGRSAITVFAVDQGVVSILLVGNFTDRYAHTSAGWKFAERTIHILS